MTASAQSPAATMTKHRIEALSDGIFAVAMTLLVLDIKMPESITYASDADLFARLVSLEHAAVSYVVSFILLGMYWVAHHSQFHYIHRSDRGLLWINLYLLLCICLVPFTTDLVGDNVLLRIPALLYGINLLLVASALVLQVEYLRRHPELATPELDTDTVALLRRQVAPFVIVPMLSMALTFYSPRFALYLYLTLLFLHILPRWHKPDAALHAAPESGQTDRS
jgi:uncharacterized membrane protein